MILDILYVLYLYAKLERRILCYIWSIEYKIYIYSWEGFRILICGHRCTDFCGIRTYENISQTYIYAWCKYLCKFHVYFRLLFVNQHYIFATYYRVYLGFELSFL